MSAFPSLPLFTDAFLADTGHLSAQETGAYLLLIIMAWRLPDCRLPDDDAKLARWARVDARTWQRIKPTVMEFWRLRDGTWTQKRLSKERKIVSKRAEVARQNGKHGGRPKSLKNKDTENQMGSSLVTQTKAPNPNPISIDSSLRSDGKTKVAERGKRGRSKPLLPIPVEWAISSVDRSYAATCGLSPSETERESQRFKNHAQQNDRKCADWSAAWRNWCLKAAEILGKTPAASNGHVNEHRSKELTEKAWRFALDDAERNGGIWQSRQVKKSDIPAEFIKRWQQERSAPALPLASADTPH